jgi:hypothetical protein
MCLPKDTVQDSGVVITELATTPNAMHCPQAFNTGKLLQCEITVIIRDTSQTNNYEYDGDNLVHFLSGISGSTELLVDGPSGHSQESCRFHMYITCKEVQLMLVISPSGNRHYMVVR